jgi:hypothetical protein
MKMKLDNHPPVWLAVVEAEIESIGRQDSSGSRYASVQ